MHEGFRHECAVRQLCKWRSEWGLEKFRKYLQQYKLDPKLLQDFVDQWQKGSKGEWGRWE